MRRITPLFLLFGMLLIIVSSCTGPDSRDDDDGTATPTPTMEVATAPEEPTEAEDQGRATERETRTPGATPEATGTEPEQAEPTATATSEPNPTPTAAETPTEAPTPSPTPLPLDLEASLPSIEQLGDPGYFLANQGSQSALDLANSYSDSSAHLERLDNWGFKEHLFREFGREPAGPDDALPSYVLATVNEYGSPEQAGEAMDWLESLNRSQGHEFVDPAPAFGDRAIASSVATADGTPSSIVFVQVGPRVYAYFAQGGQPLEFVMRLAEENTRRITEAG